MLLSVATMTAAIIIACCLGETAVHVDAHSFVAYHSMMSDKQTNPPQHTPDPLTIGELISLDEAAAYAGLTRKSLRNYALNRRLRAKKLGSQWVTTHAAVDEYVTSRSLENIPRKYRRPS